MPDTPEKPQPAPRARKGARAIGQLASLNVAPVFAKRGFAGADLAVHWPDIVGAGVARYTRPLEMKWPRHGAENGIGASLVVAAHPAFALDLQQMSPVVIERINQRMGWRCIERLTIQQRPVLPAAPAEARKMPGPEENAAAGRIAAEIRDDRLREAMTRLGATAMMRSRP
jgi:hypothetical protein